MVRRLFKWQRQPVIARQQPMERGNQLGLHPAGAIFMEIPPPAALQICQLLVTRTAGDYEKGEELGMRDGLTLLSQTGIGAGRDDGVWGCLKVLGVGG